jgi:hypothetical protein
MAVKKQKIDPVAPKDLTREIRIEAQKIYENRQKKHLDGNEKSDWLSAEAIMRQQYGL